MTQAVPVAHKPHYRLLDAPLFDVWLAAAVTALVGIGLLMVASASLLIAEGEGLDELYYFRRQVAAVCIGSVLGYLVLQTPLAFIRRMSTVLLFIALILLGLVSVPSIGKEVNGSMRWLSLGSFSLQVSEPAKLAVIIYISSYLVRHHERVRRDFVGFIKPIGIVTLFAALLLLEPDLGATAVLFVTTLGMLFFGGVPVCRLFAWSVVAFCALVAMIAQSDYRIDRVVGFLDPWADPGGAGFQVTQALMAFGRGEWLGVGLGNSIQKQFYLPEVHTDFIFAVIGEELGVFGSLLIIGLFTFLMWRIFYIGGLAEHVGQRFAAHLAYGVGLLIGLQAFINIAVNLGLLPVKGLALPLISYGKNSIVVTLVALALVLRVGVEARQAYRIGRAIGDAP